MPNIKYIRYFRHFDTFVAMTRPQGVSKGVSEVCRCVEVGYFRNLL